MQNILAADEAMKTKLTNAAKEKRKKERWENGINAYLLVPASILRGGAPEKHLRGAQDRPSREESGAPLRRSHRRPSLGVPVRQRAVGEVQDLVAVL